MNRREAVLALLSIGAAPRSAIAQAARPMRRIGFLSQSSAQANAPRLAAFCAGMLELHWVEGRDYVVDGRYANGVTPDLPRLADELVATRSDLLLVPSDEDVRLLAQRTRTIPIVFAIAQDPVGNGLAASLRRPGGNATGLTSLATEIAAKRLQLLKETFPRAAHVVLLFEPDNVGSVSQAKEIEDAAPRLGMRVTPIALGQPADIEPAFLRATALGAQAYIVTTGGTIGNERQVIADRITRLKVPSMFANSEVAEAGGLMSYSASFTDNFRRAAAYVDKIFKGEKPGDLPIEQPTKFELVINMKTAKAIGVIIPRSLLRRADRIIQ